MAIVVNSTRLVASGTSGATRALTLGSSPTAGSMILVSIAVNGAGTTVSTVRDTRGNAYAAVGDSGNIAGNNNRVHLWACYGQRGLGSGDVITVTFSGNVFASIAVDEVTGLGSAHVPDQTKIGNNNSAGSAVSTGASSATSYADELVWCLIATTTSTSSTQTITPGGSYTQQGARVSTTSVSLYTEYLIVAATGAQTATATINTTTAPYAAMLVTLPAPQSPASTQRSAAFAGAEVAFTGTQRAGGFVAAEVAYSVVHAGAGFVGAEVAFTPVPAPTTQRRPNPVVIG